MYFSDRDHLSDYGRLITGDTYFAMTDGPVPTNMYDIFKSLRGDGFFANKAEEFSKYFVVENRNFIKPVRKENLDFLSESDIEKLDDSLEKYGEMSWDEVKEKSHDYAWRATAKDCPISLKNILLEKGDSDDYISFVKEMDFVL
ncbi:MAG: Panacea domain-containing protein [Bacteroidales bacterium]|nr:Panacea domain-containing protein [Bacteroidales bacterium]